MKQLSQVWGIYMKTRTLTVGDNEVRSSSSTLENTSTSHSTNHGQITKKGTKQLPLFKGFSLVLVLMAKLVQFL